MMIKMMTMVTALLINPTRWECAVLMWGGNVVVDSHHMNTIDHVVVDSHYVNIIAYNGALTFGKVRVKGTQAKDFLFLVDSQ